MKTRLIILFGLFSFLVQSQTQPNTAPPNFAPKTPESAAFLQYGQYPVDLSTGVTNISIPLYTIEAGDFQLPIKLDYHASGIKVDQEATWVGLGWNLNFGAQLVLSAQGTIDENSSQINSLPTQQQFDNYFNANPYSESAPTGESGDVDRIRDVYMFSSPTANGSFYYHNGVAVVFPPDAFKVLSGPEGTLLGGTNIADAHGNVYVLGAKERSLRQFSHQDNYDTAWYVTKILTAKGNMIQFNYHEADDVFKSRSIVQSVKVTKKTLSCNCPEEQPYNPIADPVFTSQGLITTNSKKIKEIIFNNGASKVVFTKVNDREDQEVSTNNGYLSKMEVMQKNSSGQFSLVKGHFFHYDYFNLTSTDYKSKRLKLENVSPIHEDEPYEFEYSNRPLPSKTSYSQDFYGYYNGAGNSSLIPIHKITSPKMTIGTADRTVNSAYNQAGMLTKIKYPTKGWTKFNYEPNQYFDYAEKIQSYYGCSVLGATTTNYGTANPLPAAIDKCSFPISGNGLLKVTYRTDNEIDRIDPQENKHHFTRIRVVAFDGDEYSMKHLFDGEHSFELNINGNYTIVLEAYGDTMHISAMDVGIHYGVYENIDAAGIRIGSIENYDSNNNLVLKKQYDYSKPDHPEQSSGAFINDNAQDFISTHKTVLSVSVCPTELATDYTPKADVVTTYFISSLSKHGTENNSIVYRDVKERDISPIDSTSNGYTHYTFTTEGDWIRPDMGVRINMPWKRGKILEKKVFKTINNTNYLVNREKNNYVEDMSRVSYIKGFKMIWHKIINTSNEMARLSLQECGAPRETREAFTALFLNHPIYWYYLKSTNTTERFYNSSNVLTDSLETTKTYTYNNPLHLQLSSEKMISSDLQEIETRYFYPHDTEVASEPNVTGAAGLIERNMLATPLLVKTLKNGTVLSEQKTEYAVFPRIATPDPRDFETSLFPKYISSKKGTNPFERKITYDYDEFGNVREYIPQNGIPVSIIWGYNKTKPIAKIENAAYSSINATQLASAQTSSDTGNEAGMLTALNSLKISLPNAMMSSYTYYPLVGVKSITDIKGDTIQYFYDENGRLKFVKDKDNYILSETQYRFKD